MSRWIRRSDPEDSPNIQCSGSRQTSRSRGCSTGGDDSLKDLVDRRFIEAGKPSRRRCAVHQFDERFGTTKVLWKYGETGSTGSGVARGGIDNPMDSGIHDQLTKDLRAGWDVTQSGVCPPVGIEENGA